MSEPVAVIIGDIHFTVNTLDLATKALQQAIDAAEKLNVPLVMNGDTLDSKAIVRAECMNRIISLVQNSNAQIYVNIGNHDRINEKSQEHSLNFIKSYAYVINRPMYIKEINSYIIPYHSDLDALQTCISGLSEGSRLIMHQGLIGADMGHYVQDKTSLDQSLFANFRVIASHYHKAQDIKTGRPRKNAVGLWSYIGNPYSLTFGEAGDGPKGFAVLMSDGLLEHIATNLRKHVVINATTKELKNIAPQPGDLVWLKVTGPTSELNKLDKVELAKRLRVSEFKLDKVYSDAVVSFATKEKLTNEQLFDTIIEATDEPQAEKDYLKQLWREILTQ